MGLGLSKAALTADSIISDLGIHRGSISLKASAECNAMASRSGTVSGRTDSAAEASLRRSAITFPPFSLSIYSGLKSWGETMYSDFGRSRTGPTPEALSAAAPNRNARERDQDFELIGDEVHLLFRVPPG